jgi:hypothetical protein
MYAKAAVKTMSNITHTMAVHFHVHLEAMPFLKWNRLA